MQTFSNQFLNFGGKIAQEVLSLVQNIDQFTGIVVEFVTDVDHFCSDILVQFDDNLIHFFETFLITKLFFQIDFHRGLSVEVVRVQQFVRLVTAGFSKVFLVDGLDGRVLVRFTDGHFAVGAVDGLPTSLDDVAVTVVQRLTTTVDTAAGAGHDLDGVELALTSLDVL